MTVCGQTVKGQPDITVELLKFHSKRYDHSTIDWKFLTVCKVIITSLLINNLLHQSHIKPTCICFSEIKGHLKHVKCSQ